MNIQVFFVRSNLSHLKFNKSLPQFHVGSFFITHVHVKIDKLIFFLRQNVFIFVSKRQLTKGRVRNFQVPLSRNLLLSPSKSKSKSRKNCTHIIKFICIFVSKISKFLSSKFLKFDIHPSKLQQPKLHLFLNHQRTTSNQIYNQFPSTG